MHYVPVRRSNGPPVPARILQRRAHNRRRTRRRLCEDGRRRTRQSTNVLDYFTNAQATRTLSDAQSATHFAAQQRASMDSCGKSSNAATDGSGRAARASYPPTEQRRVNVGISVRFPAGVEFRPHRSTAGAALAPFVKLDPAPAARPLRCTAMGRAGCCRLDMAVLGAAAFATIDYWTCGRYHKRVLIQTEGTS